MSKSKLLMVLVVALVGGIAQADDQSDRDLKKQEEAGRVRTFSYVDTKLAAEFVYSVDAETAKLLPKGAQKDLDAKSANALEDVIAKIRKQEPTKVVDINASKEAATTACHDYYWYQPRARYYGSRYPIYRNNYWYQGDYYAGGSFYWESRRYINYNTVWPYYGNYCPPVYRQPVYYWGY